MYKCNVFSFLFLRFFVDNLLISKVCRCWVLLVNVVKLLISILIVVMLSSCTRLDSLDFKAIQFVSIGPSRHIEQVVTAKWQGVERRFICVLEIDDVHLSLAGLDETGLSLFNLYYDGNQLILNKDQLLNIDIDPTRILIDLQMIYWPVDKLKQSLKHFSDISVIDNGRFFYDDANQVQVEVKYLKMQSNWPVEVDFVNNSLGYSLHILTTKYEYLY